MRNFAKLTGKHLCQSLFLIKLQAGGYNFIKKETRALVFSCEFCEIFKNPFFNKTTPVGCFWIVSVLVMDDMEYSEQIIA